MSALTDRIAAEHHVYRTYVHDDLACTGCDFAWQRSASDVANGTLDGTAVQEAAAAHIATVTEAAVREQVARDIEAELTIGGVTSYEGDEAARQLDRASRVVR